MKAKIKKYKVVITAEIEACNITEAGLMLCDLGFMAGCKYKDLYIKGNKITGTEKE